MNDPADCAHISQRLGAEPVVMDSADSAFDSRPRLWWMLVDWKEVKHHPLAGEKIQWSQHAGYRQVRLGLEGRRKIPCFTTPAPDSHGRPPPTKHKLKTSEDARQRWLNDNCQFAQYADHAMMYSGSSGTGSYEPKHQGAAPQLPQRASSTAAAASELCKPLLY